MHVADVYLCIKTEYEGIHRRGHHSRLPSGGYCKPDFYSKYRYLKPDCEKDFCEKAIDRAHSTGEWCREHWKATVTIVLVGVLVAAIFMCPVTAAYLLFVAKTVGLTLLGGVIGGSLRALTGGSFWEGFEDGTFGGILGAQLFGGIAGGNTALTFAQLMRAAGTVGISVSLIGDIGDVLIKGEDISLGQMIQHAVVSAAFSRAFAAVFYGIGKALRALRPQPVGEGTGGGSSAEGGTDAVTYKRVQGGSGNNASQARIYVGINLHKEQHAAVIMDCLNEKLGEITFQNKPSEFGKLITKSKKYCTDENSIRKCQRILDAVKADGDTTRDYQNNLLPKTTCCLCNHK